MGYILAYLLIVISYATGAVMGTNPPIALWLLLALLAIVGLMLVALVDLINRSDSCKGLSDIGSGCGPKEKSK